MSEEEQEFTPTQDLVLEVLTARHRLGEQVWTFERRPAIVHAIVRLEVNGLVSCENGVVQGTLVASLTEAGRKRFMARPYNPPIMKGVTERALELVLQMPLGHFIQRAASAPRIGG